MQSHIAHYQQWCILPSPGKASFPLCYSPLDFSHKLRSPKPILLKAHSYFMPPSFGVNTDINLAVYLMQSSGIKKQSEFLNFRCVQTPKRNATY